MPPVELDESEGNQALVSALALEAAIGAFVVTPSNSVNFTQNARALYVGTPVAGASDYRFGHHDDSANSYLNGALDNVVFYSRWLSDAEILQHWNSGAGLVYPFGVAVAGAPAESNGDWLRFITVIA